MRYVLAYLPGSLPCLLAAPGLLRHQSPQFSLFRIKRCLAGSYHIRALYICRERRGQYRTRAGLLDSHSSGRVFQFEEKALSLADF